MRVVRCCFLSILLAVAAAQHGASAQERQLKVKLDPAGRIDPAVPTALPAETLNDLFEIGRGGFTPQDMVAGFEQPLPAEVFEATRLVFSDAPAEAQLGAVQRLQQLANDFPEVHAILGSAYGTGVLQSPSLASEVLEYVNGARSGDPLSQNAVNTFYVNQVFDTRSDLAGFNLETAYRFGLAPGAESVLAQQFQYGAAGRIDFDKADAYWQKAIMGGNPVNLTDYGNFLLQNGRTEEAVPLMARAAETGYPEGVVGYFDAVLQAGDEERLPSALAMLEASAQFDRAAALRAGDYYRALGSPEDTLKAAQFYRSAMEGLLGADLYRTRGMSRLGQLYLDHQGLAEEFTEQNALALFDAAAAMGDAGAFLGLARRAFALGWAADSYYLAARAQDLGDEAQVAEALQIMADACATSGLFRCAPVPVFFATTRKASGNSGRPFGGEDSLEGEASFGIAFIDVGFDGPDATGRVALHNAARRVVRELFGDAEVARLDAGGPFVVSPRLSKQDWVAAARRTADLAGLSGAFVYVHGYNNPFDAAVRGAAQALDSAGFPSIPVVLSWPSKGDMFKYLQDVGHVAMACPRLFAGLNALGTAFGGDHITLMAHSMGSQIVYRMVIGCDGTEASKWADDRAIANLIYAAPDMPSFSFEEKLADQLDRAGHMTLYVTTHDVALLLSASADVNATERAGLRPAGKPPITHQGLSTIDATDVELVPLPFGEFLNHGYVFDRPEVVADLSQLLNFEFDSEERRCLDPAEAATPDFFRIKKNCQLPNN